MGNKDRVSNKLSQGGGYAFERRRCTIFLEKHLGRSLAGKDGRFECGNKSHNIRHWPTLKAKGKEVNQAPHGGPDLNAPKRNHFYALGAKQATNLERWTR